MACVSSRECARARLECEKTRRLLGRYSMVLRVRKNGLSIGLKLSTTRHGRWLHCIALEW